MDFHTLATYCLCRVCENLCLSRRSELQHREGVALSPALFKINIIRKTFLQEK